MAVVNYQGIESKVDIDQEKKAIVTFLNDYWEIRLKGIMTLPGIVDHIYDAGIEYGIAYREKEVGEQVRTHNKHADLDKRIHDEDPGHAVSCKKIKFTGTSTRRDLNFERAMNRLLKWSSRHVEYCTPQGYDEYRQAHPEDFPEEKETLEFDGIELHHSLGATSYNFNEALKKSNVLVNDRDQGRPPLTTLLEVIFRQGANFGVLLVEQKYRDQLDARYATKR